eukprot:6641-Heterococcus_DN1.PRE.2
MPPAAKSVSNSSIAAEISTAVAAWCADPDTRNRPAKLAVKLEHEYTATNLSFAGLKGRDATVAALLQSCPQLDLFLTDIVKQETGSTSGGHCHEHKHRRHNRWDYDSNESTHYLAFLCHHGAHMRAAIAAAALAAAAAGHH